MAGDGQVTLGDVVLKHGARKIRLMDDGRIVERGTHNELLGRGGLYKEIHDLQLIDHAAFAEVTEETQEEKVVPNKEHEL